MCVAAESQCTDQEVDLVFMLDSSGSIGSRNFEIAREWLISISKSFQIGPTATQIALIQVSISLVDSFSSSENSPTHYVGREIELIMHFSTINNQFQNLIWMTLQPLRKLKKVSDEWNYPMAQRILERNRFYNTKLRTNYNTNSVYWVCSDASRQATDNSAKCSDIIASSSIIQYVHRLQCITVQSVQN